MPLPKRPQRWPPRPPAPSAPPTPPKYRPQSANPIGTRPPEPPSYTSSTKNGLNLEIESGVSQKDNKNSKCPCSQWSFKTNAIITIVVLSTLFVLFFSLFIWAMVPKNPSNESTPQDASIKSRIICVHHDKPKENMLQNQCRMIKEHCDDTKVCEAIVFSSEVDAEFMKYFWEQESFKMKTIFYLAVHGSKAEGDQPSSVSLWKHPELINDVQQFYNTKPEKAKNFLLVTAACYSGRIVLEPSYKKRPFPIINAIGENIALAQFTEEGRPTDELPMLMTQKVKVPDKISESCSQREIAWSQDIKQKFKSAVQKLRSPLTGLTFGMFEGINKNEDKGNTGFAVSAPKSSPLRLKDWNLEPTHYAFRICETKEILNKNYRVGLELHFPKQEFGIAPEERSVWAKKGTWKLQGTTTIVGKKMSHADYLNRYQSMDIEPYAGGDKIILRPDGERIIYFSYNFEVDPTPNEVLLPIP